MILVFCIVSSTDTYPYQMFPMGEVKIAKEMYLMGLRRVEIYLFHIESQLTRN